MKHSVMIPDDVWEWWQTSTGQIKPARAIRDEIIKLTMTLKLKEHQAIEEAVEDYILPDVDFSMPDDAPTLIILERVGVCMFCLRVMRKGDEAFYFTAHGRKHLAHVECWDQNQENSPNGA